MLPLCAILDPFGSLADLDLAAELRFEGAKVADYAALMPPHVRQLLEANTELAVYVGEHDRGYALVTFRLGRLLAEVKRRRQPRTHGRRVRIAYLLAAYPDRLRPVGPERWRAVCPWRDDRSPPLLVYADGHAHCYACRVHRTLADLADAWGKEAA